MKVNNVAVLLLLLVINGFGQLTKTYFKLYLPRDTAWFKRVYIDGDTAWYKGNLPFDVRSGSSLGLDVLYPTIDRWVINSKGQIFGPPDNGIAIGENDIIDRAGDSRIVGFRKIESDTTESRVGYFDSIYIAMVAYADSLRVAGKIVADSTNTRVLAADSVTIPVFKGNETHRGDSVYFAGIGRFAGKLYVPVADIDSLVGPVRVGGNLKVTTTNDVGVIIESVNSYAPYVQFSKNNNPEWRILSERNGPIYGANASDFVVYDFELDLPRLIISKTTGAIKMGACTTSTIYNTGNIVFGSTLSGIPTRTVYSSEEQIDYTNSATDTFWILNTYGGSNHAVTFPAGFFDGGRKAVIKCIYGGCDGGSISYGYSIDGGAWSTSTFITNLNTNGDACELTYNVHKGSSSGVQIYARTTATGSGSNGHITTRSMTVASSSISIKFFIVAAVDKFNYSSTFEVIDGLN